MRFCCKFHLTGGDEKMPCEDRDYGHTTIGIPLGPDNDEPIDDGELEEET